MKIFMNRLEKKYPLEGFIDTHIHTAPDDRPRILSDIGAAEAASNERMRAIVIKSHVEPTSGRARIVREATGFNVFGGVCLNNSVGGLNLDAVKTAASIGGKVIWLPTIFYADIKLDYGVLEDIFTVIVENDLVLATGHLGVEDIFQVLDMARSMGLEKLIVNHPLTRVVGASIEEQKEMARNAYMEHCYVACMEKHDQLDLKVVAEAIKEVGARRCIMATDFGQYHNPYPTEGFKMYIKAMMDEGVSQKEIGVMGITNPSKLLF